MFTGIVESKGKVVRIVQDQSNRHFLIASPISNELKVDQSLAHNGVCLTVTKITDQGHWVTAVDETLKKSNLGDWKEGSVVNLERSMPANGRFDGHIVQGHVDQVGLCTRVQEVEGSWLFDFEYDPSGGNITVEKGSVAIDGVSLTCFNSVTGSFRVTIIPYTFENTTFGTLKARDRVNLEFDILGKYIKRLLEAQK
ncbi:MAG: riboflavin synthase [Cyclobacteriaceae bacterium]|jgi:riboflavin synthase|nr:riboflavin synthase [Cyclobacteriaceae bacterium]